VERSIDSISMLAAALPKRRATRSAKVLLLRVVDDLLGLDHVARHRLEGAEAVGETVFDALLPRSR